MQAPLNASAKMDLPHDARLMAGSVPDPHEVTEHGSRFRVHVLKG